MKRILIYKYMSYTHEILSDKKRSYAGTFLRTPSILHGEHFFQSIGLPTRQGFDGGGDQLVVPESSPGSGRNQHVGRWVKACCDLEPCLRG